MIDDSRNGTSERRAWFGIRGPAKPFTDQEVVRALWILALTTCANFGHSRGSGNLGFKQVWVLSSHIESLFVRCIVDSLFVFWTSGYHRECHEDGEARVTLLPKFKLRSSLTLLPLPFCGERGERLRRVHKAW
jgi:hypothetical protein